MKEDFLHHVWRHKLFDQSDLKTTGGRDISIVKEGYHNHDAGPDFSQAKIIIDEIEWNGNVEIHINASDWYNHQHQSNPAYENVILHVVWKNDKEVTFTNDEAIPCLELQERVSPELVHNYKSLILNQSWVACENNLESINHDKIKLWLNSIAIERLNIKSNEIIQDLDESTNHWEMVFCKSLFRAFGLKVNQDAFTYLFESIPFEKMIQLASDVIKLEALLYGQAGFLSGKYQDQYPQILRKEYLFLKHKYSLEAIAINYWKFARMRPANFPTVRIAQLCQLLSKHPSLFQKILEYDTKGIKSLFEGIMTSSYWESHYRFDESSKEIKKKLGKSRVDLILINAVAPAIFTYGKIKNDDLLINKALELLESIPAENNSILTKWSNLGIESKSALESQSLIHLKKYYCDHYKCIQCQIGVTIISQI